MQNSLCHIQHFTSMILPMENIGTLSWRFSKHYRYRILHNNVTLHGSHFSFQALRCPKCSEFRKQAILGASLRGAYGVLQLEGDFIEDKWIQQYEFEDQNEAQYNDTWYPAISCYWREYQIMRSQWTQHAAYKAQSSMAIHSTGHPLGTTKIGHHDERLDFESFSIGTAPVRAQPCEASRLALP